MFYTRREARELLGFTRKKMARYIERGLIPGAIEDDRGRIRFEADKLVEFATSHAFESLRESLRVPKFFSGSHVSEDWDDYSTEKAPKKVIIERSEEDCPEKVQFLSNLTQKRAKNEGRTASRPGRTDEAALVSREILREEGEAIKRARRQPKRQGSQAIKNRSPGAA